jgi:hypothetical protein
VIDGLQGITVTGNYDIGFRGLIYNLDGTRRLFVDTAFAPAVPAHVTWYADRIEVYQYSSGGVLMVFYGKNFETNGSAITGIAPGATFTTDPLAVRVRSGLVTGSVQGDLLSVIDRAVIRKTISGNVSRDSVERFSAVTAQNNLSFGGIGCTMTIQEAGPVRTGAANITLAVPGSWVNDHGGSGAIRMGRINETSGVTELLATSATGPDAGGSMVFSGESKNGTSLFGLLTATPTTVKQGLPVTTREVPLPGAIVKGTGLWILILVLLVVAAAVAAAYFRSQKDHD